ncbi:MAG TPA: peptide-methionine (R)-S-oxide reductase [Candidatus Poseidoniales archaeon]|nr:MAG TPA: peptide-methionine (R)-S-oxide reductase [Candidatus Poseidoniales archaeon]
MNNMVDRDTEWRDRLTDLAYRVTRKSHTERPFTGKYYLEERNGNYFCICCNHLLFTSEMKYHSGCGWPAFHTEHKEAGIRRIVDLSHGMRRIEVKCGKCDAHLGHVFDDGPKEYGGERYCINSVCLDFVTEE